MNPQSRMVDTDVLVIGSGLAGMTAALALAPRRVTVLTKTDGLIGGSSELAQGGIAAALHPADTTAAHAADTVAAGAGLVDGAMAALLTAEGADRVRELLAAGVPFDRDDDGAPHLGREAAHSMARVAHAGGDATGRVVVEWLSARVAAAPHITTLARTVAVDLVTRNGRVLGALAWSRDDGWVFHRAHHVVLATGGVGAVFARTTNPAAATGDGLAMAARAGAELSDLEFVQFHPTALAVDGDGPAPLLTEALRGAGATLLDRDGRRFMLDEHPLAELAPRDVVARAVGRLAASGEGVWLDMRPALAHEPDGFPTVLALCALHGFDPFAAPVPVAPAAHYHMGGVVTDADGRTSLKRLWACGETARTGVHGANRLASNSLLEALVFGRRVADAIAATPRGVAPPVALPEIPVVASGGADDVSDTVRGVLYREAGLVRDGEGLRRGLDTLERLSHCGPALYEPDGATDVRAWAEARNRLTVGRLILASALAREESRGAHHRGDFPEAAPRAVSRRVVLDGTDIITTAEIPVADAVGETNTGEVRCRTL